METSRLLPTHSHKLREIRARDGAPPHGIGLARRGSMSGEPFDSGAVLSRARPVLTFATLGATEAPGPVRPRTDTPTPPPVSWHDANAVRVRAARSALPVIPRIVRRTVIDHRALRPIARAASAAQRAGLGTLLFVALGLATLGAIAGLGMRSLSEEASLASGSDALAVNAAHVVDATAAEHLLPRAPAAVRVDHVAPHVEPVHVEPSRPTHSAAAAPARPAPSHLTFAAAHAAAAKKRSSTALARR